MAGARFNSGTAFEEVRNLDTILENSRKEGNKLVTLLLNIKNPERGSIEWRMMAWRKEYEKGGKSKFYKCSTQLDDEQINKTFQIKDLPTIIFYRDGSEIGRIENLEESNPDIEDNVKPGEKSNDEKRVKKELDEHCKSR